MAKRTGSKTPSRRKKADTPPPAPGEAAHLPEGDACTDLDRVIGHGRAVETLRAAAASGRVHHAWVFSGPMGVGKRTTAEAFAATLMAAPADAEPETDLLGNPIPSEAGDSETLAMLRRRTHPDFHFISKELAAFSSDDATRRSKQRTIPINVIRQFLIEPAYKAATHAEENADLGVRKVFLVDEAELLRAGDNAAQNALLKTLEEPPEGTVIILVTSREDALLPTIRSRCQRVVFGQLDDDAMQRWLDERSGIAEELDEGQRSNLLAFADGSPGRLLLAHRTGIGTWHAELDPMLRAAERSGSSPGLAGAMKAMCADWAEAWVKARPLASKESANHAAVDHMLALLSARYRDRLRSAAHNATPGDRAGAEHATAQALSALDAIADARDRARANVNLDFVFAALVGSLGGAAVASA